jgi:hypothetical protein
VWRGFIGDIVGYLTATIRVKFIIPGDTALILPSHRLDLYIVPKDPESNPREAVAGLLDHWMAQRIVDSAGLAESNASALVPGGFRRVRVDDPGRVVLYANQMGGFRVACAEEPGNIVAAFRSALSAWRGGGPRSLDCPACGAIHPLEALAYAPPAAFGRVSVVVADVEDADLTPEATSAVSAHLGEWTLIRRRV